MASENTLKNIIVWLVVGLIAAALAISLSMPQLMPTQGGTGPQTLVKVFGEPLRQSDWAYQFRVLANTIGGFNPKDEAQQKQVRAREVALETLIERELAVHIAEKAGLRAVVEDAEELVKKGEILIAGDSYFWRDEKEPFNYEIFQQSFVPRFQVNERDYLEHQRKAALTRTFYDTVAASVAVSQKELRSHYESQADRIAVRIVRFRPQDFEALVDPSDAEIAAYIKQHRDQLEKQAEEQKNRYLGLPPQIEVSLIELPKEQRDQGKNLVKRLRAKKVKFKEAARQQSTHEATALRGGYYGWVNIETAKSSPGSIDLDKELLARIANMPPAEISTLVEGEQKLYIAQTQRKRAGDLDTEAIIRELAVKALRAEKAKPLAKEAADKLHKRVLAGTSISDLQSENDGKDLHVILGPAAKIDLSPEDIQPFNRSSPAVQLAAIPNLVKDAWNKNEAGKALDKVYEHEGQWFIAEITGRDKPSDEGFDEAKEQLQQSLQDQRAHAVVGDLLRRHCESALGHGDIAPNSAQLRRLFGYGPVGEAEPAYNICKNVGARAQGLRYARMMQQFRRQMGS